MTTEAQQLMAAVISQFDLKGAFSPVAVGKKLGFTEIQSQFAARELSNMGVLVLGFDSDAHFSSDFRKMREPRPNASAKKGAKSLKKAKKLAKA